MPKFRISSHGRLQDWIAVEQGYFNGEGLDYEFDMRALENADQDIAGDERHEIRVGAYELYLSGGGGKKNMSCACHWVVNQGAGDAAGRMLGHAYSVLPSGIYTPASSSIRRPEDLAAVEVAVGHHSGSHFSTLQTLEPFLPAEEINLGFGGFPYDRVDALLGGDVPAAAVWGAATYLVEQHGCRRILDSTFMAGFMFGAETDPDDVAAKIEMARYFCWKTAHYLDQHDYHGELIGAMCKIQCTEMLFDCVYKCMQVVGVNSLDRQHMFEKYLREAALFPLYDAGNFGMQRRRMHGVMADPTFNPRALMDDEPIEFTKAMETIDTVPGTNGRAPQVAPVGTEPSTPPVAPVG